jgi:hypothetical protein
MTGLTAGPNISPRTTAADGGWSFSRPAVHGTAREPVDARRRAQLVLGGIWLLDGVLQFQPYMFTKDFATQMLAPGAQGNPAAIADPITWAARITADHPVGANAGFALIQVLLGLAIAWRPSLRAALAASVVWSVAVWWLGEGLGGVLNGGADPISGAPGAVILYALAAVLVWPRARDGAFTAARAIGAPTARALWLVLWGSLAWFAVQPYNDGPGDLHDMIAGMTGGQPRWMAWIGNHAAEVVGQRGLAFSVGFGVVLAAIALGIFLPERAVRPVLVLALVVSAVIWIAGEDAGTLFGGQGTDPNSGPLLALLAVLYWPLRRHDVGDGNAAVAAASEGVAS